MGLQRVQKSSIFMRRPTPSAVRLGLPFVRIIVLAVAGICGSMYGLARGWNYQPKPMFVPAPEVLTEIDLEP